MSLSVRKAGFKTYAVFDGGVQVSGGYSSHDAATTRALNLAKKEGAALKERACLCCGATFESEGPHNRMCGACRRHSSEPFPSLVATQGRRARKVGC